jgi:uncharacterized protein YjbI with pentapeptide repeats
MFNLKKCGAAGCANPVVCLSEDAHENVWDFNNFCFLHAPDPERARGIVFDYIRSRDKIVGMNLSYMRFCQKSLSGKKFYGCVFKNCQFEHFKAQDIRMRMCVFDFSQFINCEFSGINAQFSSFACSTLCGTRIVSCELVNNNFCGIDARNSIFDDADLYNSRFIRSHLEESAIVNCNLQRASFYEFKRVNVSFKLSSTREALFSESENVE